jgi:hypothetical protein
MKKSEGRRLKEENRMKSESRIQKWKDVMLPVWADHAMEFDATPLGLGMDFREPFPRVPRSFWFSSKLSSKASFVGTRFTASLRKSGEPWAGGRNPVGIVRVECRVSERKDREDETRMKKSEGRRLKEENRMKSESGIQKWKDVMLPVWAEHAAEFDATPLGLGMDFPERFPRVPRSFWFSSKLSSKASCVGTPFTASLRKSGEPWAGGRNPVGIVQVE